MLKFLFWVISIYLVYRLLTGWIVPRTTQSYINKQKDKYRQTSPSGKRVILKEGQQELIIPTKKSSGKDPADHMGEEVEYEEERRKKKEVKS